jgi:hypothetical protein
MTKMTLLAAAAALTLATGSAFAATPDYPASAQPAAPQQTATTTDQNVGGSVYQPNVAAPGETAHVIGGQTFYYNSDAANSLGSDGSSD